MITTTGERTIAQCSVLLDDTDALTVYATPQSPRIAVDANGDPVFSLVEYRRDVSTVPAADRATKLGGGLLTFSVDLARSAAQDAQIRDELSRDPALHQLLATPASDRIDYSDWWNNQINQDVGKLAAALKINALPVEDGNVAVAIDGEDAAHAGEFVATVVGAGKVSMTGDERAAFSAKLTMDGVALMWDMIDRNLAAIWIGYQLTFTSRLDGVTMICHCDTAKTYHAAQEQWQHLSEDGSYRDEYSGSSSSHTYDHASSGSARDVLTKIAIDTEAAWVKVVPTGDPTVVKPDMIEQLTTQGWNMITAFLAENLLQSIKPDDFQPGAEPTLTTTLADAGDNRKYGADSVDYYSLKSVDESVLGSFDASFDEKATVTTTMNPTDNLSNVLAGHSVDKFRAVIDLNPQFYRYVDVQVSCTADWAVEPVDMVKAHLEYHGSSGTNKIDEVKDLEFTKDASAPQFFSTYLAAPDQITYSYAVDVFYSGSTKTFHLEGRSDAQALVLDTDTLGILAVDVQVGIVDWDRFKAVQLELSYGTGVHTTMTLTSDKQSDRWTEVLGTAMTGNYSYVATWVDKNNQQLQQPSVSANDKRLVVNMPERESLSVTLVPAGAFGDAGLLSRIVTALRYDDEPNKYEQSTTITMASSDDVKSWDVPLVDTSLRTYQYQVNVFYSDGLTRSDETWLTTDRTVLAVGDPYGWRVQFIPYLLKNPPGAYTFATLHVEFNDAAGNIAVTQDFPITDFSQPVVWRFRLAAPERHSYTYVLTLYGTDPAKPAATIGPVTDTKEVVVLTPGAT